MRNIFLFLTCIAICFSCKKDATKPATPLSITSIAPTSGNPGTEVTINGSNFSTTLANNTVKFNSVVATVTSATSSALTVKVPVAAGNGPITVTTSSETFTGPSFTYIPDVIVGGVESNGTHFIGKYWKNGTAVSITDGTKDASIYSMAIVASDVYLAGSESNGTLGIAAYWKNGVAVPLTDGTNSAGCQGMVVVGNDVYVAGTESNGSKRVAKYWKNGVAVSLTDGTGNADASYIAVNVTDIYVTGTEEAPNGVPIAKYWKNGVPTVLSDGTNDASSGPIAVSGNDVYIIWAEFTGTINKQIYWKNGVAAEVPGATQIDQLLLHDGDVYMAGKQSRTAVYWKNGTVTALTDGSNTAYAHDIKLYGNDVYVTGNEYAGGIAVCKYWKNGVATTLTDGTNFATSWGIFIQ